MMIEKVLMIILLAVGPVTELFAHGGTAVEFDQCVVQLGKHRIHFTAYQPMTGGEELCWALPNSGKTIMVFDLFNIESRKNPLELRLVELTSNPTSSAQQGIPPPMNVKTIASTPSKVYPTGTISIEAEIKADKKYMAVLTLSDTRPLVLKAPIGVLQKESGGLSIYIMAGLVVAIVAFLYLRQSQKNSQTT